ncbi:hypothetical protein [Desulfovibrio ferrophilus]|uniref:NTP pyrophosphohydrolases including oxidative damage repair enzymes n=1 Tax=Desulfovibrio ferrophilus TaxID=241368 RepID=A0A2Z6B3T3_9BACT|nr:hypothetical protein [Desulfovibrio ferrophilus]BBD10080.1 NTP pyrophosphohydrolases including oxidative damage repair enzymes [Desulfovibrio ferrophilus]
MAGKGTKVSRPKDEAKNDKGVDPGVESIAAVDELGESMGRFREDVLELVRELRSEVDESLRAMRSETKEARRKLREDLIRMRDERKRFFVRVEDMLADAFVSRSVPETGMEQALEAELESEVEQEMDTGSWLAEQEQVEQAMADSLESVAEGLEGRDMVMEAEAIVEAAMKRLVPHGKSHVEQTFVSMHGLDHESSNLS